MFDHSSVKIGDRARYVENAYLSGIDLRVRLLAGDVGTVTSLDNHYATIVWDGGRAPKLTWGWAWFCHYPEGVALELYSPPNSWLDRYELE